MNKRMNLITYSYVNKLIIFTLLTSLCLNTSKFKKLNTHQCYNNYNSFRIFDQSFLDDMYDLNNDNINVSLSSENSNNPNEDRLNFKQLNFIRNGYYLAVYDGHGGDFVSNYANERFPLYFEENYLTIEKKEFKQYEYEYDTNLIKKQREVIIEAIKKTFSQIERELYLITEKEFETGNQNAAFVGSCALVIIIHNNEIISANLGDSKAMLFRKSTNSTSTNIEKIKIINRHNSAKQTEREKLIKNFPNDPDVVQCQGSDNKYCYVKGMLQVTRAFADFHLKYNKFKVRSIKQFNGPYITSEPEILTFNYETGRDYLVVASDGMWDELSSKDVERIINESKENKENKQNFATVLLYKSLENAANGLRITINQLKSISPGKKKRNMHDDISIIVFIFK